ncbi:MAG: hypothetical protein KDI90_03180 [Alphaproteobacteria bacterium]|nr:hypothetical protein [Alphaproteobacteria bacterium]
MTMDTHSPEAPSRFGEALASAELRRLIHEGAYRQAMEFMDVPLHAHPDPENDPHYVRFFETLCLVLHEGGNLVQADAILDRLKTHIKERGLEHSPVVEALNQSLKGSSLYKRQWTIDPEISGVEP